MNKLLKYFLLYFISLTLPYYVSAQNPVTPYVNGAIDSPYLFETVNVITGDYCENTTDFSLEGPQNLAIRRTYISSDPYGQNWYFNHPNLANYTSQNPQNPHLIYEHDKNNRLTTIKQKNPQSGEILHTLNIQYNDNDKLLCSITADTGESIKYLFEKLPQNQSGHPYLLSEITHEDGKSVKYTYRDHPVERRKLLTKRETETGDVLINEYYDSSVNDVAGVIVNIADPIRDFRIGRVKLQKGYIGSSQKLETIARYFYHDGYTEVYDHLKRKTIYRYGNFGNLTAIESYSQSGSLLKMEMFFWSKEGIMVSHAITNNKAQVIKCETFNYDTHGNIIKKTLHGNLTGLGQNTISLNNQGHPTGNTESYSHIYRYSEDDYRHLLYESEDNGLSTRYLYEGAQLTGKLSYFNQKISTREFFKYDNDGHLIETIQDDGKTEEKGSTIGITQRKVTRFTFGNSEANQNKPEQAKEYYVENGIEHLLRRGVITYSSDGQILKKEVYSPSGELLQEETPSEKNDTPLLEETRDRAGRVISESGETSDGKKIHNTYKYDHNGNRIASIDIFGHETLFDYDALNQLIKTTYPQVVTGDGQVVNPTEIKSYNSLGYPNETTDPNGNKTYITTNVRGQPIKIDHPDGSTESFTYTLDGKSKTVTAKNNITTSYTYTFSDKPIEEKIIDKNGQVISLLKRTLTPFHIISETDLHGRSTNYKYDGAGRLEMITRTTGDGQHITEYRYDQTGKVVDRIESYSDSPEKIIGKIERNSKGEIETVSVINENETLLKRQSLPPEGAEPIIHYIYDHINERGENVLQTIQIENSGNQLVTTFDACGRPDKVEKIGLLGELYSTKKLTHDLNGNKIYEEYETLTPHVNKAPYIVEWSYGPCNRLEAICEGKLRTTRYSYHTDGSLAAMTKPDGTTLHYEYNPSGKISKLISSDQTVDTLFTYDNYQRVIQINDNSQETTTTRKYDEQDHIIEETLANGLTIKNRYDLAGRRRELTLPDGSTVTYDYNGTILKSVTKILSDGTEAYTHTYKEHNLKGQVESIELIGHAGIQEITYDENGRTTKIAAPEWQQEITYDLHGNVESLHTKDPSGSTFSEYNYDSLGQVTNEWGTPSHSRAYDSLGNPVLNDIYTWTTDNLLQLTETDEATYRYDLNGNLKEKEVGADITTYNYDTLNRLTSVVVNGQTVNYSYDPLNRRVSFDNGTSQKILWDGKIDIGTTTAENKLTNLRVMGIGKAGDIGAAIAIELNGEVYAPIHDHRGSVACLINAETSEVTDWFRYSTFGMCDTFTNREEPTGCPWRFSSKRTNDETGFVDFGHRSYDPKVGRWITPDPAGTPETINRYVFAQNNPLNRIDPNGLFSFSDIWNGFVNAIESIFTIASRTINTLQNHLSLFSYYRPEIESLAETFLGKGTLYLAGFYQDRSETGVYGKGELNDKVRITLINGILNARIDYKQSIDNLSKSHGDCNVHYFFDATEGWTWDILKAAITRLGYVTPQANVLVDHWRKLIDEMGGVGQGGTIIHYAHSIGCAHTATALKLMTPEERAMIRVNTFGAPYCVDSNGLNGAQNYVSVRDGVCLLDPISYFGGLFGLNNDVVPIGTWLGVPFVDHTLNGGSYLDMMNVLGDQFLEEYLR